jgi:hypothetical protein
MSACRLVGAPPPIGHQDDFTEHPDSGHYGTRVKWCYIVIASDQRACPEPRRRERTNLALGTSKARFAHPPPSLEIASSLRSSQ